MLAKDEKPLSLYDQKTKLNSLWKLESWHLISLCKGYYHVLLHYDQDRNRIWSLGAKPNVLRLQAWILNFNHKVQTNA